MTKLIFIHGAGSSNYCWNYLVEKFRHFYDIEFLNYDIHEDGDDIINRMIEIVSQFEKCHIIGHSFGGILAWHIAQKCDNVKSIITIATPWGGWNILDHVFFGFQFISAFFKNIARGRKMTTLPRTEKCKVKHLNIIATRSGVIDIPENDGVVTVKSQQEINNENSISIMINASHNEILSKEELFKTLVEWIVHRNW